MLNRAVVERCKFRKCMGIEIALPINNNYFNAKTRFDYSLHCLSFQMLFSSLNVDSRNCWDGLLLFFFFFFR